MSRLKIVADEKIPYLKGILDSYAEVRYLPATDIDKAVLANADALLIRTRTKCNEALLEGSPVKFIATATIGHDHIDKDYCKSRNICWVNAPGCNSSSVQQYMLAALLVLSEAQHFDLQGKTLGIIGVGNVGSKIQKAAGILGMKLKLNDPPRYRMEGKQSFTELDELLQTCDIVSLHVPLNMDGTDRTFHLFDQTAFGKMKNGAWLINSSRGEVVDTASLKNAMLSGNLGGAILDVFENEPNLDLELLRKLFISTPHIAGYSTDGKANGTSSIVESCSRFFKLPVSGFYPELPAPQSPEITIDGKGKTIRQVLLEAVNHTYPIFGDHVLLQQNPSGFEKQRENYPLRREFPAYRVRLLNANPGFVASLRELGFLICTDPGFPEK